VKKKDLKRAMIMVFWDVTSSTLIDGINILEETYACIFRVELISHMTVIMRTSELTYQTCKDKVILLQAWCGPEGE